MFLLNILKAVLAYDLVKIRLIKEKEVILFSGNTNDESRGIQLIGPGYLQKVIKGVNWLLFPIDRTFICENTLYLTCNGELAFFTSDVHKNYHLWSCKKECNALVYLLDNIIIRLQTKFYSQTVGIPTGTNCTCLVVSTLLCKRFYEVSLSLGKIRLTLLRL